MANFAGMPYHLFVKQYFGKNLRIEYYPLGIENEKKIVFGTISNIIRSKDEFCRSESDTNFAIQVHIKCDNNDERTINVGSISDIEVDLSR